MKNHEVECLQQLVEQYWCLLLERHPESEPPSFLVNVINYLEERHRLLFNTVNSRWHET